LVRVLKKNPPKPANQKTKHPKKFLFKGANSSRLTIAIHNTKMMPRALGKLDINKLPTMNGVQSGHLWELGEKMATSELL